MSPLQELWGAPGMADPWLKTQRLKDHMSAWKLKWYYSPFNIHVRHLVKHWSYCHRLPKPCNTLLAQGPQRLQSTSSTKEKVSLLREGELNSWSPWWLHWPLAYTRTHAHTLTVNASFDQSILQYSNWVLAQWTEDTTISLQVRTLSNNSLQSLHFIWKLAFLSPKQLHT